MSNSQNSQVRNHLKTIPTQPLAADGTAIVPSLLEWSENGLKQFTLFTGRNIVSTEAILNHIRASIVKENFRFATAPKMQFGKMDTSSVLTITEMLLKTSSLYYYLSQYGSGNNRINFGINQVIDILRQLDNLHDSILIIENLICDYFYHGATVELVRLILAKAIENNVQLFITTNNLVFIEEFIQYLVKTDNQDLGTFVMVGNSAMKSSRGQPIATEVSIDYMLRSGWDFRTLI